MYERIEIKKKTGIEQITKETEKKLKRQTCRINDVLSNSLLCISALKTEQEIWIGNQNNQHLILTTHYVV